MCFCKIVGTGVPDGPRADVVIRPYRHKYHARSIVGDDDHIVPKRLLLEEKLAFARNEQMTDVV